MISNRLKKNKLLSVPAGDNVIRLAPPLIINKKHVDEAINIIDETLKNNDVCLFMKGTPEVPQCGFSLAVSNVLKHLNVNFKGVNVLEDPEIRECIKIYSDWPTIPQLYIKKEFIGGCDIIKEMFESGDLQKKFQEKKIKFEISKNNNTN